GLWRAERHRCLWLPEPPHCLVHDRHQLLSRHVGGGRSLPAGIAQTRGSMMRKSVYVTGAVALLGLSACGDHLSVPNLNNPDTERVLSSATGIEAAVEGLGSQLNNTQRGSESVNTQAKLMAEENYASVANFGMAARVANWAL